MLSEYDPAEVSRAALHEGLAVLAHVALHPFGYLPSPHRPLRRRDLRTVVFVHGLVANRATFLPLQIYLRLAGYRRQLALNYPSRGSIEAIAVRLKTELDAGVKGGRIDLVAHSMGGLAARYYLQRLGGARRVDRLITLGTPHCGTHAAVFVPSALVRQLAPDGPFLRHLSSLPPPPGVRVTSIAAGGDLLVLPRESALCPFGERYLFDDLGHLGLLFSPRVFAVLSRALAEPAIRERGRLAIGRVGSPA